MAKKKSDGTETTDIATDERPDARARLRAFEDDKVGPDAVRINDEIERGSGSRYAGLSEDEKRQHTALMRCVEIEGRMAEARTTLASLEAEYDAALADSEPRVDPEEKARAERQAADDKAQADKIAADREAERKRDAELEDSRRRGDLAAHQEAERARAAAGTAAGSDPGSRPGTSGMPDNQMFQDPNAPPSR